LYVKNDGGKGGIGMKRKNLLKGLSEVLGLVVLVVVLLEAGVAEAWLTPIAQMKDSHSVNAVAFSPDGQYLASGSGYWDKTIKLWEVKRCLCQKKLAPAFSASLQFVSYAFFISPHIPDYCQ